ncbi:MAG: hypothetical protein ACYDIA_07530 [Candidatus Humimicrobiaceae bacterium]
MQVIAAGAVTIPMSTKNLVIPKVLTPPEVKFKAENIASYSPGARSKSLVLHSSYQILMEGDSLRKLNRPM